MSVHSIPKYDSITSQPWTPIYNSAYMQLAQLRYEADLRLMMFLFYHADRYGLCRPSQQRLCRLMEVSSDAVIGSVKRLIKAEFIRLLVLPDELGEERSYIQISPFMVRVRPSDQERVENLWVTGRSSLMKRPEKMEKVVETPMFNADVPQPEQAAGPAEAESPEQPERKFQRNAEGPEYNSAFSSKAKNLYTLHNPPYNSHAGQHNAKQSSYLETFLKVKPLKEEEALASAIANEFGKAHDHNSTHSQMLDYIRTYGYDAVAEAFAEVRRRRAKQNNKVNNPPGLLVILIRANKNLTYEEYLMSRYQMIQMRAAQGLVGDDD